MPREYAGGAKRTQLVGDITAASTTFTVADATGWPTGAVGPFAIAFNVGKAGEEKVLVQSRSGNTLTVAASGRGYDGTSATTHQSGASVDHVITAVDIREATSVTTAEGTAYDSARLGGKSAPLYLLTSDANTAYSPGASALPINVHIEALNSSDWNTNVAVTGALTGFLKISGGLLGAFMEWDVDLAPGTWRIAVMHRAAASHAQVAVKIDGTTVGTLDFYDATDTLNRQTAINGVAIATRGRKRLRLEVTGKNASSSAMNAQVNGLQLLRTA